MVAYTTGLKNLVFFNDVHSYSQLVLTPWGWTIQKCPGKDDMDAVFQRVSASTAGATRSDTRFFLSFDVSSTGRLAILQLQSSQGRDQNAQGT